MNFCLIYIVDEAHENTSTSSHKKVSDHNPDYLPTNVVMPQGVNLSFLDADAHGIHLIHIQSTYYRLNYPSFIIFLWWRKSHYFILKS
jgi:hypothetical protein